jgi:arylsulfatase A-like enzyme
VPLIISVPGTKAGRTQSIVELMDLFPTLAELAGRKIPGTVQGKSLQPVLKDPEATVKASALSFIKGGIAMRSKDWAYTRYRDGSEELYDMKNDREQFTNRAREAKFHEALARQRASFNLRVAGAGLKVTALK